MLRIAMLADLPESGEPINGGVQAVTNYLVKALQNLPDIDLHVLRLRQGVRKATSVQRERHHLHILPMSRLGTITAFWHDQRIVDDCLNSIAPDVVHSQGAGHYGILACRSRFPAVITVHGILNEEIRYEVGLRKQFRLALQARYSNRLCIRNARHTIMISQYVAEYYGDKLTGRRYFLPNPIDNLFFDISRKDLNNRILFAGRVRKLKGVSDLLIATSRLNPTLGAKVIVAGSLSDRAYVQKLRSLSRKLGIEHRIEFTGLLDIEQLKEELSTCSCLVLPSYQETAPMVVQEAMAAGVPVVASAIGGIPYQVKHGETGFLFRPGDIDSLCAHLSALLSDSSLRAHFGQHGKDTATRNYSAAVVAEKTVNVYRDVVGLDGRGDRGKTRSF